MMVRRAKTDLAEAGEGARLEQARGSRKAWMLVALMGLGGLIGLAISLSGGTAPFTDPDGWPPAMAIGIALAFVVAAVGGRPGARPPDRRGPVAGPEQGGRLRRSGLCSPLSGLVLPVDGRAGARADARRALRRLLGQPRRRFLFLPCSLGDSAVADARAF